MLESGVYGYHFVTATVSTHFPLDRQGRVDARCCLCQFYRYAARKCGLNGAVCEYPDKYVGSECPFIDSLEDDDE